MELVVTELEPKERFKCEVCAVDFYKRWNSLNACQKMLEKHLKTQSHKHNVERREQGLGPERVYNLTSASKRLGELVDRLENRIEDLERVVKSNEQYRRADEEQLSECKSETTNHDEPAKGIAPEARNAVLRTERALLPAHQKKALAKWLEEAGDDGTDYDDTSSHYTEATTETDISAAASLPPPPTKSIHALRQAYPTQNQQVLGTLAEPETFGDKKRWGPMMSRSVAFKPTPSETEAVYQYDGQNYASMTLCNNMLTRLMVWVRQHLQGVKLETNTTFLQRTQTAINRQIRQRMNAEPTDAEDTEAISSRLYSILEHDFDA